MKRMQKSHRVACVIVCLLFIALGAGLAIASMAAPGYAVTDFATGFPTALFNGTILGPIGLAFDASGNLFVGDAVNGLLYKFGPAGGVASTATQLNTTAIPGAILALAFTKDSRLYLTRQNAGDVLEIDPSNGTVIRTVASIVRATGLATDPLSGDLFVSQSASGGQILRISNFASGPGTVTPYAGVLPADGLAFGPDGTLYAAIFNGVAKIAGTNAPTPGAVTFISASVPSIDGIAVSAVSNIPFLYGNRNDGIITKIDLSTNPPTLANIATGGSRGDFTTVGFDGCLYATQSDRVVKVTNADGTCLPPPLGPLFPSNPLHVFVDIKPQSCPNPINVGASGTLAVAILGTSTFDLTTIDPSSVKLQGVSPLRYALEDVATPFTGTLASATSCTTAGPDGFNDLVLVFDKQAVSAALGPVTNGQVLVLTLTGNLLPSFGGTAISGQDVVIVINK